MVYVGAVSVGVGFGYTTDITRKKRKGKACGVSYGGYAGGKFNVCVDMVKENANEQS